MRPGELALDGALLVDKPSDWTSHDVVAKVRGRFKLTRVGHCGTLDPMATGLLVLVFGAATRLSERLMSGDKTYEGGIRLGETTNTLDAEGELLETKPVPPLTVDDLRRAAKEFEGDQLQTPPMVSAVKVDGVPLHQLARRGVEVERKPRLIHVYRFDVSDYEEPFVYFEVACTKGTYVRVLAADLGARLGCGAHLARLRRTSSGGHRVEDATPLEEILGWTPTELAARIEPMNRLREIAGRP
jgi:tRNA pseudouridine55 synthase